MTSLSSPIITWYEENARDLPWRTPSITAWDVLVCEFMLQQTPVERVKPHFEAWVKRWPTPTALAEASPAEALTQWSNLGYPRRALWLHIAATQIRDRFDGIVPSNIDDLLSLTGIGDYTARAVAVFAYGHRHPVVDTNTRRVLARSVLGRGHAGPPSRRDLDQMSALLPDDPRQAATFNAAVMELGAMICTARNPRCQRCPIAEQCRWLAQGRPNTPDTRRRQARYEGSDRQARGAVLRALRDSPDQTLPRTDAIADWPDPEQRERAISSLITDGLVVERGNMLELPQRPGQQ